MSEVDQSPKPTGGERVRAVLETLTQPSVTVDLAVGAAASWVSSSVGAGPEVNMLVFLAASNVVGPVRGELQKGYKGGNDAEGKLKVGGEWWYEGDHRTVIGKFAEAIRTGRAPWS